MWFGGLDSHSKEQCSSLSKRGWMRAAVWLLWLLGIALLAALGNWQWQRAEQKQVWLSQRSAEPLELQHQETLRNALDRDRWVPVRVWLEWLPVTPLLLDNRTHNGRAGYEVLQPARLMDGTVVVVNRGWLAAPASRAERPDVASRAGAESVAALAGKPVASFTLANVTGESWRLQSLSLSQASDYWGLGLAPWVLWLSPTDARPSGGTELVRRVPGDGQLPPQRHLGYAVQWFALALTLLVLGLWLEWRRRRE